MEEADFYLLRSPALPYSNVLRMNACSTKAELADFLRTFYQSEYVQNALFLASAPVYSQLKKWLAQGSDASLRDRLLITLYKYALRMSTRSTPFGMFSGVSLGQITTSSSSFVRSGDDKVVKKIASRPSTHIATALSVETSVKFSSILRTNSTLYRFDTGYRYYEYQRDRKEYLLSYVETSAYLDYVVEKVQHGIKYCDLIQGLNKLDVPSSVAEDYIDQLIKEQLLVCNIKPSITGQSIFEKIAQTSIPNDERTSCLQSIKEWEAELQNSTDVVESNRLLEATVNGTLGLSFEEHLIHADMRLGMSANQLNDKVTNQIKEELVALSSLFQAPIPVELDQFKRRFVDRYDNEEIPLLEVMDSDIGIGYGDADGAFLSIDIGCGDILDPLRLPKDNINIISTEKIVFDLYIDYLKRRQQEIVITDEFLKSYIKRPFDVPPSPYYALGSLHAENSDALDSGQFQFSLQACGGPSAIPLMTRFCHAEPALKNKLKGLLKAEEDSEEIYASIAYVPEDNGGQVVQRPSLRSYEIPLMTSPEVDNRHSLDLKDLLVSVVDDQIILRSRKNNKRVIPRLDSAHNYKHGMIIYRFLGDLQFQDQCMYVNWDWGALENQDFLPRVCYKHIVLSRARWLIKKETISRWKDIDDVITRQSFVAAHNLPSRVMLAEGDNELLIDFRSPLAFDILFSELRKNDVVLLEPVNVSDGHIVTDCLGNPFTNEIILPVNNTPKVADAKFRPSFSEKSIKRRFSLGSEWVYLKVYCGIKTADRILTRELSAILAELDHQSIIKQWFFIRYKDSDYHLRIRFNLATSAPDELSRLLRIVHQRLDPLVEKRYINNLQFGTYCREIERYGSDTMELSENLFHVDSEFVANALISHGSRETDRLLIAMYGVNQLLDCFGLQDVDKLAFVEVMSKYFLNEQGRVHDLKYEFDKKYRYLRRDIDALFENECEAARIIPLSLYKKREAGLSAIAEQLNKRLDSDNDIDRKTHLLQSYSHMFQNRIFLTKPRLQEALTYHCLWKYYRSVIKRKKEILA